MLSSKWVQINRSFRVFLMLCVLMVTSAAVACDRGKKTAEVKAPHAASDGPGVTVNPNPHQAGNSASGRDGFRFETFGNEGFWTDAARLPKGMVDAKFTPRQALEAGLQVDIEAVDPAMRKVMEAEFGTDLSPQNAPALNDPKNTVALINANAVVGVVPKDTNGDGKLDIMNGDKVGIACTICHTITDLGTGGSVEGRQAAVYRRTPLSGLSLRLFSPALAAGLIRTDHLRSGFGLSDCRDCPRRWPQSPCAERMTEKSAVTPSAMRVQTKKKPPLEFAMPLAIPTPFPFMWMKGIASPRSDRRRRMTYLDGRSASTSVAYSQTTEMRAPPMRFESPPSSIPRTMSSAK